MLIQFIISIIWFPTGLFNKVHVSIFFGTMPIKNNSLQFLESFEYLLADEDKHFFCN